MNISARSKLMPNKEKFISAINIIGGVSKMANLLNVKKQTIYAWLSQKRTTPIPDASYCQIIEDYTNGEITKYELRPDIFNRNTSSLSPENALKNGIALIRKAFKEIEERN